MKAWQGSLGLAPVDGIVSPAYFVFEADFDVPRFGEYLLRSKPYVAKFAAASDGVRIGQWDLDIPRMRNIQVSLPQAEEQAAIVRYLAHANARIDKAIAAKCRLISLLDELDRSVENGLAGSISSMASGGREISWLGALPYTWLVVPAKRLLKEVDRRSKTGREGLLSLRMREGLVDANEFTETPIPPEDLVGYKIVHPGELVMNRMRASIGLFGVAKTTGLVSPDYSTMTVADGVDPHFYLHLFKTDLAMAEFRRRSNGLGTGSSGFMRLYYEDFGPIALPLPPIEEQRRVVQDIQGQHTETLPIRSRASREITLLQEFRARLVADVVTGQVDVRGIAATLPDAPESFENAVLTIDDEFQEVLSEGEN
ncbi:hypothetical protein C3V38_05780 [Dietzia sp. oral taxon 368]|nr:hypothetical protein C3V38_05780 [Dietzia sp. oral taxon 368]